MAASSPGGFPILRTGHIASYPLTPMESVKQIYLDLFLYTGNSGGPVYYIYSSRYFKGAIHLDGHQGILGLVIQENRSNLPGEYFGKPLNLATIIPAPRQAGETRQRAPLDAAAGGEIGPINRGPEVAQ